MLGVHYQHLIFLCLNNAILFYNPTYNEHEYILRKVTIHRKIRQKMINRRREDHILHHNDMLTWNNLGLNRFKKLSEAFWATQPIANPLSILL